MLQKSTFTSLTKLMDNVEIDVQCTSKTTCITCLVMTWLQLWFDFDSTAFWFPFNCNWTVLWPFNDLRI